LLDAVIGNTDRHQDNWATIRSAAGHRLAPSFDHASSLGFLLSDEERVERLTTKDSNRSVAAYAARARTKFEGAPTPVELALDALRIGSAAGRRRWTAVLLGGLDARALLAEVPDTRISSAARAFAARLLETNVTTLSQAIRTMAP
jgi:hypothetical protein